MTVLPASGAADARGPSPAARSASVPGPRELLSTTWCPASMASRATALPIFPLPMNPTVVIFSFLPEDPHSSNALLVRVRHPSVVLKLENGPRVASPQRAHGWLRLVSRRNGLEDQHLQCPT